MGDIYADLIRWAMDKGVELAGVEPRTVPGTGIGMFATRSIQVIGPLTALTLS
jgi:hypothetical protein